MRHKALKDLVFGSVRQTALSLSRATPQHHLHWDPNRAVNPICRLQDYLALPDRTSIYKMSTLDSAMTDTYNNTRDFVMRTYNLTEDQAITAITTLADFGVTQVVDGKGLSGALPWAHLHAIACLAY